MTSIQISLNNPFLKMSILDQVVGEKYVAFLQEGDQFAYTWWKNCMQSIFNKLLFRRCW